MLHIGTPKTGTTFLQAVLFRNRDRLKSQGILIPGSTPRAHAKAAVGVRLGPTSRKYAAWRRIVAQSQCWPETVLISNEWFSMVSADQARAALHDLGAAEAHVVVTARDFAEQVPSAWQETLKVGVASSLEDFVVSLDGTATAGEEPPYVGVMSERWRWSVLDPAAVLGRWNATLPSDRLHVVTVPPKGSPPNLLWRRFAGLCGIEPEGCSTDINQARESIGVESARLLQALGPALHSALGVDEGLWHERFPWIQRYFAHELLLKRGGNPIALGEEQLAVIRARSKQSVHRLEGANYDVVGDLADLTAFQPVRGAKQPNDVTDSELLALALSLVPELLARVRLEHERAQEATPRSTPKVPADARPGGERRRRRRPVK